MWTQKLKPLQDKYYLDNHDWNNAKTLIEAQELFDDLLLVGDVVQWPTMLLGYTKHDKNEDVIQLYPQMLVQGLLPNLMTFFGMLKGMWQHGRVGSTYGNEIRFWDGSQLNEGSMASHCLTQDGLGKDSRFFSIYFVGCSW